MQNQASKDKKDPTNQENKNEEPGNAPNGSKNDGITEGLNKIEGKIANQQEYSNSSYSNSAKQGFNTTGQRKNEDLDKIFGIILKMKVNLIIRKIDAILLIQEMQMPKMNTKTWK